MGVTRIRRVRAGKKKDMERALKWIIYPPVVATALAVKAIKPNNKNTKKK